jgi:hypothetical protein
LKRLGLKLVNFSLSDRPHINDAGSAKKAQVFILMRLAKANPHSNPPPGEVHRATIQRIGGGSDRPRR